MIVWWQACLGILLAPVCTLVWLVLTALAALGTWVFVANYGRCLRVINTYLQEVDYQEPLQEVSCQSQAPQKVLIEGRWEVTRSTGRIRDLYGIVYEESAPEEHH